MGLFESDLSLWIVSGQRAETGGLRTEICCVYISDCTQKCSQYFTGIGNLLYYPNSSLHQYTQAEELGFKYKYGGFLEKLGVMIAKHQS